MTSPSSKSVLVTFLDAATGESIARAELSPEQLPDTFAMETELDLGGSHYQVVRAEPRSKAEFTGTGQLTVVLQRVELVDPRTILFSLPSLCGAELPPCAPAPAEEGTLVLHEDDWRQCELVASVHHEDIGAELESIRRIHATAYTGAGWREVHVRERIATPLPEGLRWGALVEVLGEHIVAGRIAFGEAGHRVRSTVAASLPAGVVLWGIEGTEGLSTLCIQGLDTASLATVAALKRVTDTFSLVLVDWCTCRAYGPEGLPIHGAAGDPWPRDR